MTTHTALLKKAKSGDQKAIKILLHRYEFLILKIIHCINIPKDVLINRDDLKQEAWIAFYDSINSYKSDIVDFSVYSRVIIRNRLLNLVRKRKNELIHTGDSDDLTFDYSLVFDNICFRDSVLNKLKSVLNHRFSRMERDVMYLYLQDFSYVDMSKILGINEKSVDNALQRTKHRIIESFDEKELMLISRIPELKDILLEILDDCKFHHQRSN